MRRPKNLTPEGHSGEVWVIFRRLAIPILALLLAVGVVRDAAVSAFATLHPARAARIWASHPSIEISLALADIGRSSRERRAIDPHAFAMIDDAALKSPLSAEPFLVHGVRSQMSGNGEAAKRAFLAAQWRDPRSVPAAYFLAAYYLRSGEILRGLQQMTLLARLSPGGADAIAPFVAAYAHNRSTWPQMRFLFRSQSALEDQVLAILAGDPQNTDAILALADKDHRKPDSLWLRNLLQSLVASGDYPRARQLWSSIGRGQADGQLLFDSSFSNPWPPPPFNWALSSSTVGLAERQPGERLHLIFYGNEDGVLATELVSLSPGSYRVQMRVVGQPLHPEALRWSVRCDRSADPFASVGFDQLASRAWTFEVPANCPAQWVELSGRSGDIAQQSDVTITGLSLTRVGTNA